MCRVRYQLAELQGLYTGAEREWTGTWNRFPSLLANTTEDVPFPPPTMSHKHSRRSESRSQIKVISFPLPISRLLKPRKPQVSLKSYSSNDTLYEMDNQRCDGDTCPVPLPLALPIVSSPLPPPILRPSLSAHIPQGQLKSLGKQAAHAYAAFLQAYPEYHSTWIIDTLRRTDFIRLDRGGETYVDYMGGAQHPECLVRAHSDFLTQNIMGNTHSVSNR